VLPGAPGPRADGAHDACVGRLVRSLEGKDGVVRAHVEDGPGGAPRLCPHYDPERLPLPFAVGLSRAARRVVRQNLFVSLGRVAVLIPATLFGLNLGLAVLFHEGSTLVVVANALRLLVYRRDS
jgi:hypothetical protein